MEVSCLPYTQYSKRIFLCQVNLTQNPYTNEIDTGSNQYHQRWVTSSGDEFYTDEESINPNYDGGVLGRQDWKHTPIRSRRPLD